ncbi:MAG: acetylesterase, partial [Verrucomicrobiae bacterium]|nr:acetylesterase [Verrucomicrobiae bacterium]NNJ86793.1 acetylesterase [Akkermansiaceae bacterium]
RGTISNVYRKLSYEEIKPLLPAIYQAVKKPAPSGIMFAGQIRLAGLKLLAKHKIQEGIPLCLDVMQIHKWGKKNRITGCLDALDSYGAAAKPMIPELKKLVTELKKHREQAMMKPFIERIQKKITELENTDAQVELRSLKS